MARAFENPTYIPFRVYLSFKHEDDYVPERARIEGLNLDSEIKKRIREDSGPNADFNIIWSQSEFGSLEHIAILAIESSHFLVETLGDYSAARWLVDQLELTVNKVYRHRVTTYTVATAKSWQSSRGHSADDEQIFHPKEYIYERQRSFASNQIERAQPIFQKDRIEQSLPIKSGLLWLLFGTLLIINIVDIVWNPNKNQSDSQKLQEVSNRIDRSSNAQCCNHTCTAVSSCSPGTDHKVAVEIDISDDGHDVVEIDQPSNSNLIRIP